MLAGFDLQTVRANALLIAAVATVLILGMLILRTRNDLRLSLRDVRRECLGPYREAYERGLMTEQEFRAICESVEQTGRAAPPRPPSRVAGVADDEDPSHPPVTPF